MPMNSALKKTELWCNSARLLDIFITANLAFLALDVFVAHAANKFARKLEWLPCAFALIAALLLVFTLFGKHVRAANFSRLAVGWSAVIIGIVGMLLHLRSRFFVELTLKSLVYTAPFVAPLAFTGLGLLLLLTVYLQRADVVWGQWVVFLAGCGWGGNFLLSVLDHAQNGFFNPLEWLPVCTSALAVGVLLVAVVKPQARHTFCLIVLGINVLVGMLGFVFHLPTDLQQLQMLPEKLLYDAPIFAPLLFVDLAILATLGVKQMQREFQKALSPS